MVNKNKKKSTPQSEAPLEAPNKKKKVVEVLPASAPAPAPEPTSVPSVQQHPPTTMEVDASTTEAGYPPPFIHRFPPDSPWNETYGQCLTFFPGGWRKMEIVEEGYTTAIWLKSWEDYNRYAEYVIKKASDAGAGTPRELALNEWTPPPKPRRIRRKPQKFLVRGLPWQLTTKELEDFLCTKGLKTAVALHQKTDRSRPPLFLVHAWRGDGERAAAPNSILSLTEILGVAVKISKVPHHMDTPPQCFRCQAFGHIAKHCRAPEVCVACGGPHRRAACTLKKTDPPRCHNCGGPHVASWRGCKAFFRAQQRSRKEEKTARTPRAKMQPTTPRRPRAGRQGAAPAGGPQPASPSASRRRYEMAGASAQGSALPATPTNARSRRGGNRARQRGDRQSALRGRREQEGAPAARQNAAIDPAVQAAIDAAVQRAVATAVQAAVEAAMKNVLPLLSIQSKP